MGAEVVGLLAGAACLLGAGIAVVRHDNARQGSVAWATPVAWLAFIACAALVIAAAFFAMLGSSRT